MNTSRRLSLSENIFSRTLPNGLGIHVYPNRRAPVFAAQVWVATGSIHEEEFLGCGLSHFLEHMMFNGSRNYPSGEKIRTRSRELGLSINAWTNYHRTVYVMHGGSAGLSDALDLLADLASAPLFPEKDFRKEKDIILREYAMGEDDPDRNLFNFSMADSFRVSPLRIPVIGTQDGIASVTRDMMIRYHERRYSPHRCHLVVVGDADPEAVFEQMEKKLSGWKRTSEHEPVLPAEPLRFWPVRTVHTLAEPQVKAAFSFLMPGLEDPRLSAAETIACLLDGGDSALLPEALQIRNDLAIHASTSLFAVHGSGILQIFLDAMPEKYEAALDGVRGVLEHLCEHGITEQQRLRAVRRMETDALSILRSARALAGAVGHSLSLFGSVLPLEMRLSAINALTPEDIRSAACGFFSGRPETLTLLLPENVRGKTKRKSSPALPFRTEKIPAARNGNLLLTQDMSSPFAGLVMYLRGGAPFETRKTACLGRLLSECLFCGTEDFPEEEFKKKLDDHAIDLSVSVSFDGSFQISLECLKKDFSQAVELLISMLARPAFPEKEVEREKSRIVAELEEQSMQPVSSARDIASGLFFPKDSPYSIRTEEMIASIRNAAPDALRKYLADIVLSRKDACFGAHGSLTRTEARAAYDKIFSRIPWRDAGVPLPASGMRRPVFSGKAEVRPKSQTIAMYLMPHPPLEDKKRFFAMQIVSAMIAGTGSVIFDEIREKRGLAYYASLAQFSLPGDGMMMFYAGTREDAVPEVFRVFESIRKRFAEKGLTREEIEAARIKLENRFAGCREDCAEWSDLCVRNEYRGNGFDYPLRIAEMLKKLSPASVNRIVREVFSSPERKWVIVSPKRFGEKQRQWISGQIAKKTVRAV